MYLTKRVYIGANYEHNQVKGKIEISKNGKPVQVKLNNVSAIVEQVGYWRKANQIHNWFVQNVQDGEDNCAEYYVSLDQLKQLRETCITALVTKNAELIPPTEGFFFGSTEIDQFYWDDLKDTVEILADLDENADYYYNASW